MVRLEFILGPFVPIRKFFRSVHFRRSNHFIIYTCTRFHGVASSVTCEQLANLIGRSQINQLIPYCMFTILALYNWFTSFRILVQYFLRVYTNQLHIQYILDWTNSSSWLVGPLLPSSVFKYSGLSQLLIFHIFIALRFILGFLGSLLTSRFGYQKF